MNGKRERKANCVDRKEESFYFLSASNLSCSGKWKIKEDKEKKFSTHVYIPPCFLPGFLTTQPTLSRTRCLPSPSFFYFFSLDVCAPITICNAHMNTRIGIQTCPILKVRMW